MVAQIALSAAVAVMACIPGSKIVLSDEHQHIISDQAHLDLMQASLPGETAQNATGQAGQDLEMQPCSSQLLQADLPNEDQVWGFVCCILPLCC